MASAKLNPRQRMINLMYLVLTALLALQISDEIVDKVLILNKGLENTANALSIKNELQWTVISAKADKDGRPYALSVKETATQLHNKSRDLVNYMGGMKKKLFELCGGGKKGGEAVNYKEIEKVVFDLIGHSDSKSGEAYKLEKTLNEYVDFVNGLKIKQYDQDGNPKGEINVATEKYRPLAIPPEKDNSYNKTAEFRKLGDDQKKDWVIFNFEKSPLASSLAVLSKYMNDVLTIETQLMKILEDFFGAVDVKITGFEAKSTAISRIVPSGLKYEADIFLAPKTSSLFQPEIHVNMGSVKMEGAIGKLTIPASGNFPPGKNEMEVTWSGSVSYTKPDGATETLPVTDKFIIRKPEIVVTSAAVQILYKQCGNPMNIDVPALAELYDPRFSGQGVEILPSQKSKKTVTLVPTSDKCTVTVSSNTPNGVIKIGDVTWNSIDPPKPSIKVFYPAGTQNELNVGKPLKKQGLAIDIKIISDKDFQRALPDDAVYKAKSAKVYLKTGLKAPEVVDNNLNIQTGAVKLYRYVEGTQPGSLLIVELKEVVRINFQGKEIPIELTRQEANTVITLE